MALARSTDNSSNNSCNNSHKRRGSDSSLIDLNRFSSNSEVSDVSSNVAALQPFGAEGFNYSYYIMEDGEHHLPVEKLINYLIKIEQELVLSRHGYRSANNSLSNSLKLNSPVDSCNNSTKGLVDAAIDSKDISVSGNQQGNSSVKNFEMLTAETLAVSTDPELLRILKSYGWAKDHYETNSKEEEYFQASELLQALQNLYLKQKNVLNDMYLQDIAHDLQQFEELTSFCPDTLLVYLQKTPSLQSNDIPCFSFTGACMLADISGFSKFSGEMCQKGVRGLDDLREATNGFLGYFVEVVYEYKGDGKSMITLRLLTRF